MEYSNEQIRKAVEKWTDDVSLDVLIAYYYETQLDYFLHNADGEEIDSLMREYGE